jgi:hypothetical protein
MLMVCSVGTMPAAVFTSNVGSALNHVSRSPKRYTHG